jgi:hypothetical protein
MPCQKDSQDSGTGFPLFPPDFEQDTPHFLQAIAEHNYERVADGLPPQNYFQLSDEERSDVTERAHELKFADRFKDHPKVIPLKPRCSSRNRRPSSELRKLLDSERRQFNSIARLGLVAGIGILIAFLVMR